MKNKLMIGIFEKTEEERYKIEPDVIKSNDPLTMYSYTKIVKKGKDIKEIEDKFLSLEDNDYVYYWAYDMPNADIYRCINILHDKNAKEGLIDCLVQKYLLTGDQTLLNDDPKSLKK